MTPQEAVDLASQTEAYFITLPGVSDPPPDLSTVNTVQMEGPGWLIRIHMDAGFAQRWPDELGADRANAEGSLEWVSLEKLEVKRIRRELSFRRVS
jgi:hypothetical protein